MKEEDVDQKVCLLGFLSYHIAIEVYADFRIYSNVIFPVVKSTYSILIYHVRIRAKFCKVRVIIFILEKISIRFI